MQKGYEALPGIAGKDTKPLWGGTDELAAWGDLASRIENEGRPASDFFKAVLGEDPGIEWPGQPALGARRGAGAEGGGTQFHITPQHYRGLGKKLGDLRITTQAVEAFFASSAAQMNEELIVMFNSLADLTDNIGRFFLVDCGGQKCSTKDESKRNEAGDAAIDDARILEDAVVKSVSGMREK